MNKVKQLPYGVSDFEYVMRGNYYYYKNAGTLPADCDIEAMIEEMRPWYDNYCFAEESLKDNNLTCCNTCATATSNCPLFATPSRASAAENALRAIFLAAEHDSLSVESQLYPRTEILVEGRLYREESPGTMGRGCRANQRLCYSPKGGSLAPGHTAA